MLTWFVLLAVNFGISWANANYVGKYWSESKATGGRFRKYVVCGYVMAICGFTMVYGCILLISVPFVMRMYGVNEELVLRLVEIADAMLYVMIAIPVIIFGFRIWIVSVKEAWENPTFGNTLTASWNTYAQMRNTVNAAREMPSAFGKIFDALLGGKRKKKGEEVIVCLAIVIVILALCSGYFTANTIMKRADAEYDAFAEIA